MSKDILDSEGIRNDKQLTEIYENIKDKYKLKKYKYKFVFDTPYKIKSIVDLFSKHINAKFIRHNYNNDSYDVAIGSYITDDLAIIINYYPFLDDPYLMFVLSNDKDKIINMFVNEVIYESGIYTFSDEGGLHLNKCVISNENEPIISEDIKIQLQNDIDNFFNNKKFYEDNNLTYKRGLLFFGTYGVGKSSILKHILSKQKDCYSIIVDCGKNFSTEFASFLDAVCKNKKKIIVFEDIDKIASYNKSTLFNFLDGINVLTNSLIIATTNNIQELDGALINRPSRFDRLYEFKIPTKEERKKIFKLYFNKIDFDLDEAVNQTEGFTGAYIKELFILKHIQNCTVFEAINNIKKQFKTVKTFNLKEREDDYFG